MWRPAGAREPPSRSPRVEAGRLPWSRTYSIHVRSRKPIGLRCGATNRRVDTGCEGWKGRVPSPDRAHDLKRLTILQFHPRERNFVLGEKTILNSDDFPS
jgi:hypothetical protein